MKQKPVRVCDVSRMVRISSSSLIDFLRQKGFNIINDYLSPLSSRMVELIQNGMNEGPPLMELNPLLSQAEEWEKQNPQVVNQLHTPPPPKSVDSAIREFRPRRKRQPRISFLPPPPPVHTGKIPITPLDLELIQRALALDDDRKTRVRDYLRRKTILAAISRLEE